MELIKINQKKIVELTHWLNTEIKSIFANHNLSDTASHTPKMIHKVYTILTTTTEKLNTISQMLKKGEKKEFIVKYYNHICIDKKNELIEICQSFHGTNEEDFFHQIVALYNNIVDNLEADITEIFVGYDRYYEEKNSQRKNRKLWLEKLYFPIVVAIIVAISTFFINYKLSNMTDTQKQQQHELKHIEHKYKITKLINNILTQTRERVGNLSYGLDNLSGVLQIARKTQSASLSTEDLESFNIQLDAMRDSFKFAATNNEETNNLYEKLFEEADIYDVYYQQKLKDSIKELHTRSKKLDTAFQIGFLPTYEKLINNFVNAIKQGNVLNMNHKEEMQIINDEYKNMEKSISDIRLIFHEMQQQASIIDALIENYKKD